MQLQPLQGGKPTSKPTRSEIMDYLSTAFREIPFRLTTCRSDRDDNEEVLGCDIQWYDRLLKVFQQQPLPLVLQLPTKNLRLVFTALPSSAAYALKCAMEYKVDTTALDTQLECRLGSGVWNSLYPHQQEAVRFAICHQGRVLIADDMGLGKTREALVTMHVYAKRNPEWKTLIITTAKCRGSWVREICDLLDWKRERICMVKSASDMKKVTSEMLKTNYDYVIVSFTLATTQQAALQALGFPLLIVDESQATKNLSSKRSKAITALTKKVQHAIYLSGTPMEKPRMLFPTLHALYPAIFPNFESFAGRYCDPQQKTIFNKTAGKTISIITYDGRTLSNELHLVLTNILMIRRLQAEANISLPPKHRVHITLEPDEQQSAKVKKIMEKVDMTKLSMTKNGEQNYGKDNDFMNAYRKVGKIKLPMLQDFLQRMVQDTNFLHECVGDTKASSTEHAQQKIIVFAHHEAVLDAMQDVLEDSKIGYVRLDGKTDPKKVEPVIECFQKNPNCRVILLSITAAAVGITLTAGTIQVFAELHPSAEMMIQGECRAHRIGQTKPVTCVYLILKGSIDEPLWYLVNKKYKNLTAVVDGKSKPFFAKRITLSGNRRTGVESDDDKDE